VVRDTFRVDLRVGEQLEQPLQKAGVRAERDLGNGDGKRRHRMPLRKNQKKYNCAARRIRRSEHIISLQVPVRRRLDKNAP
jgi:hypothetical protein